MMNTNKQNNRLSTKWLKRAAADPIAKGKRNGKVQGIDNGKMDKHKRCVYIENTVSSYFLMKTATHCARVSIKQFREKEWPCFTLGPHLVKFNACAGTREQFLDVFKQVQLTLEDKLWAQTLVADLSNAASLIPRMMILGYRYMSALVSVGGKVLNTVNALLVRRVNRWFIDMSLLIADIASRTYISGMQLAIILARMYRLYEDCPIDVMAAQSWESVVAAIGSFGLPRDVVELIRRLSIMTNTRVLEDITILHQFGTTLVSTLATGLKKIPGCEAVVDSCQVVWQAVAKHHFVLYKANGLVRQWRAKKSVMMNTEFRQAVQSLWVEFDNNEALTDWARTSAAVGKRAADFKALYRLSLSYENSTRPEPVCIALEGPPGCFKSRYMGMLLDVLGKSVYTHHIKTVGDGKDFYDQYDGQDIFVMDDLGQGGPSQYRTLMNLVSPIKYPLDCASEKLKDTKYFCSEAIMFTTNAFSNLPNLTKQDGIADPVALWRRAVVFDFADVVRNRYAGPNDNVISGVIRVRSFDTQAECFTPGYPGCRQSTSFRVDGKKQDSNTLLSSDEDVLVWMGKHYQDMVNYRKDMHADNKMPADVSSRIAERLRAEGYGPPHRWMDSRDGDETIYGMLCDIEPQTVEIMEMAEAMLATMPEGALRDDDEYNTPAPSRTAWYQRLWDKSRDSLGMSDETLCHIVGSLLYLFCIWVVLYLMHRYEMSRADELRQQSWEKVKAAVQPSTSMNEALAKQTYFCSFYGSDKIERKSTGLVTGRYIIAPWHAASACTHVSIQSRVEGCRLLDNAPVKIVWAKRSQDVVVLQLDASLMVPFKQVHHLFKYSSPCHKGSALVTPVGVIPLHGQYTGGTATAVVNLLGKEFRLDSKNSFSYEVSTEGLCGSLLVNNMSGIAGVHVAGNDVYGKALLWTEDTVNSIIEVVRTDALLIPSEFNDTGKVESGVKLDLNFHLSTPKHTNLAATPLFEAVGKNLKEPVDLSKYGAHTVKSVFKKSTSAVQPVVATELEFAKEYLHTILEPFAEITEEQVVRGFDQVAPLNMDAATGVGCLPDREAYIDKEGGRYTSLLHAEIDSLVSDIHTGQVNIKNWVAKEALKDEARGLAKEREPRSFRVLRLPVNVLCKQLTGEMVNNLIKTRHDHGILIGINPYNEWANLYARLYKHRVIAADIKKFDGNMLPQVQFIVRDVLVEKFEASESRKKVLSVLLTSLISNIVAVNDDVYLTTHSMPSGCYLTAIMNSLVHKCYTAMWYKNSVPTATLSSFYNDIEDCVYGDDKLCVVKSHFEKLNAITMRDYFESIGLGLSTADKKAITQPFDKWEEVNFLKRMFVYHPQLKRVMCPLVDDTILSMLNWWDTTKEFDVVMQGKITSFLHEIYLREDYEELRNQLSEYLDRIGSHYRMVPTAMIKQTFERGELASPYAHTG
jgi:hypothetical protein